MSKYVCVIYCEGEGFCVFDGEPKDAKQFTEIMEKRYQENLNRLGIAYDKLKWKIETDFRVYTKEDLDDYLTQIAQTGEQTR